MQDHKTNKTLVNVILDRSGSMTSTRTGTIEGYNEFLNGLRADKDIEYSITLIQFDAPAFQPELTVSYQDRALADVPALTEADYAPRGNTPLYDAIGECVRRVDSKDRAVIVLVITDGHENASTEFTKDAIRALIADKEKLGWTFSFLGANIDSFAVGGSIGVAAMNVANYTAGNEKSLYSNMTRSVGMRARMSATVGVYAASATAFLSDEQRAEMTKPSTTPGGRPAAPHSFRVPPPQPRKPRDWSVKSA